MALTTSNMLPLGTKAPAFTLFDTVFNKMVSLDDYKDYQLLVIMWICNHCPYVIHINSEIIKLAHDYAQKNVGFIAISSNDIEKYPQDGPQKMKEHAELIKYPFVYLFDETQEIAKAYDAACTPDFYVFNHNRLLKYRGRLDDSKPNSGIPLTGKDLRQALDKLLKDEEINETQYPSMGCNIKWKTQS